MITPVLDTVTEPKVIRYSTGYQLAWFGPGYECKGVVTDQDATTAAVIVFPTEEAAKAAKREANRVAQQMIMRFF